MSYTLAEVTIGQCHCGRPIGWGLAYLHQDCTKVIPSQQQRTRQQWDSMSARVSPRIFARDGNQCVKCHTNERLTVDHIRPIAKGGSNHESNLQTLCVSCNSRKGSK